MAPRVGMHALTEADEPALQALLREVYGETYSYRSLYEPGGVAALLRDGRATLWGDFDADGRLAGHTGILHKDPRGDYAESGLSFKRPRARAITPDAEVWRRILAEVGAAHAFVHQNTTTRHPLAQRYAERYMAARATGLIVGYAVGERLAGHPDLDRPMDAVTMTTRLAPSRVRADRPRMLPPGPWGAWLRGVFAGFDLPCTEAAPGDAPELGAEVFERVAAIDLVRRVAVPGRPREPSPNPLPDLGGGSGHGETGTGSPASPVSESPLPNLGGGWGRADAPDASPARTELLHLPTDGRVRAFARFEATGYVPVGVRLHATRTDEIVLQRLPREARRDAIASLRAASLTGSAAPLVEQWITRCAQTT